MNIMGIDIFLNELGEEFLRANESHAKLALDLSRCSRLDDLSRLEEEIRILVRIRIRI